MSHSSIIDPQSSPKRLRVLVTGGSGFIGSNLVRFLIEQQNCEVINLDKLTYAANPEALKDLEDHPNYQFEQFDLAQPNVGAQLDAPVHASISPHSSAQNSLPEIFEKYQPDAVIHLAAESHVDRSIDGPGEFIQTNVVGTYNLLQVALAYWKSLPVAGCENVAKCEGGNVKEENLQTFEPLNFPTQESFRFLHVSTDEVYGSLSQEDPPATEHSTISPRSPYSASKAAADHLVQSWHTTYGLPTLIARPSNNYGPNQHFEKLIPKVIQCCLKWETIPVYGDGSNVRDWIHVEDSCEALHTILTKGQTGEIYNIGANNERPNIELVRTLCAMMDELRSQHSEARSQNKANGDCSSGKSEQPSHLRTFIPATDKGYEDLITFVTDRPGHDFRYALDSSKLRDQLGWQPKLEFDDGLKRTVEFYCRGRQRSC